MRRVAYYLAQFHPNEINDAFWGGGFTEWHNVARARPLYPGHVQPVLPGKMGFYDLRAEEVISEQLSLAASIGVDAFCYWHYWFAGRRLLHAPVDRRLALPDRSVKFMLGWANESWTGIWHGLDREVIVEQTYDRDELDRHARLFAGYARDDRHLRVGGRVPFLIYKPLRIPDTANYLAEFRERFRLHGGEDLYLIGNWGPGPSERIVRPADLGIDALVANNVAPVFRTDLARKAYYAVWAALKKLGLGPEIRDYASTIDTLAHAFETVEGRVHGSVVFGWDNTPRSGRRGLVLRNYDASTLERALRAAIDLERRNPESEQLLFLKSWNEWAEGNVIEPRFHESWSVADVLETVFDERERTS